MCNYSFSAISGWSRGRFVLFYSPPRPPKVTESSRPFKVLISFYFFSCLQIRGSGILFNLLMLVLNWQSENLVGSCNQARYSKHLNVLTPQSLNNIVCV